MNISIQKPEDTLSRIFRAISSPIRVRILTAIGKGEACVCHLEAILGLRQAYISQQLMEMRDAGLLETRREGRYIFYRLSNEQILELLLKLGTSFEIPKEDIDELLNTVPKTQCGCPHCNA